MALSKLDREKFRQAAELSQQGRISETRPILEDLVARNANSGLLLAVYANTCWDLGEFAQAELSFAKAVRASPSNEKVSLGYFHFLWELDKKTLAVGEITRFRSCSTLSQHYQEIADECTLQSKIGQP